MALSTTDSFPKPFGRYLLQKQLASGGMGAVFLGRIVGQQGFDKWVAVKTVHQHIATEEAFLRMFAREARLCARIDHPNVCQVFDFGEEAGTPYLAMEFLKGEPVSSLLRQSSRTREPIPFAVAARIIADAARGLHAAHELALADGSSAEVVHRDVSPQNLFVLFSGITKVVDFGVARWRDTLAEQSRSGGLKGKLAYMSPEQASAEHVDRRTDVFALGAVLWEMLTSTRLFGGTTEAHTLRKLLIEPIRSPREVREEVPESLAQLTLRALSRDRAQRHQTAEALAWELERWLAREAMGAGVSEVARYMGVHFSEHASELEELLHTPADIAEGRFSSLTSAADRSSSNPALTSTGLAALPPGGAPQGTYGAYAGAAPRARLATGETQVAAVVPAAPRPSGPSRLAFAVLGVAALALGVGASVVALGMQGTSPPQGAATAVVSVAAATAVIPSAPATQSAATRWPTSASASALPLMSASVAASAAPSASASVAASAAPSASASVAASASAASAEPGAEPPRGGGSHRREPRTGTQRPGYRPMTDYEP